MAPCCDNTHPTYRFRMYAREAYTLCYFFNLYKWGSYVNAYVRAPLFLNTDTFLLEISAFTNHCHYRDYYRDHRCD
ncbi:hypothetical protein MCC01995_09080 [Bifidobacteriaceae bacterium MCC01995]|nr:hypothetical protein MCC01995_09080 [Bifidobacteriaceae bacterium MCC01995]